MKNVFTHISESAHLLTSLYLRSLPKQNKFEESSIASLVFSLVCKWNMSSGGWRLPQTFFGDSVSSMWRDTEMTDVTN